MSYRWCGLPVLGVERAKRGKWYVRMNIVGWNERAMWWRNELRKKDEFWDEYERLINRGNLKENRRIW